MVPGSSAKVIMDILFPRLIFNLTLAFRALTEKQDCGGGGSGWETSDARPSAGPQGWLCLGMLGGWSVLNLRPLLLYMEDFLAAPLSLMPNSPEHPPPCLAPGLSVQTQRRK